MGQPKPGGVDRAPIWGIPSGSYVNAQVNAIVIAAYFAGLELEVPEMDIIINKMGHYVTRVIGIPKVEFQSAVRVTKEAVGALRKMPPVFDMRGEGAGGGG